MIQAGMICSLNRLRSVNHEAGSMIGPENHYIIGMIHVFGMLAFADRMISDFQFPIWYLQKLKKEI